MRLFDYDRATSLMEGAGIDLILASTKSNVSYLLDYYADPCNESLVLDDGSMYYQSFVGLPSDPHMSSFFTPWIGEVGYMTTSSPWVQDRLVYGEPLGASRLLTEVARVNSRHSWDIVAIAALVYGFAVVDARARCSM